MKTGLKIATASMELRRSKSRLLGRADIDGWSPVAGESGSPKLSVDGVNALSTQKMEH